MLRDIFLIAQPPLFGEAQLSKMSREAHPIKAAERRQILAPGASPGSFGYYDDEPRRGERFLANLSPLRGSVLNDTLPRPSAVATICRRSAGSIRTRLSPRYFV